MTDTHVNNSLSFGENDRRILIVDDDAIICEIAESILGDAGWKVAHAYTPEKALEQMATGSWPIVLCDVHLPGDSGELLHELRYQYPQTQVIMITGDPTIVSMRQAMLAGAYDYMLKPVRREEMLRVTEMALDKYVLMRRRDELEIENTRYRSQLEDILNRKTEQLHYSELRYRTLFDNAADAILLANSADGTVCELNAAACRLIGRKSFDINGASISEFVDSQLDHVFQDDGSEFKVWRIQDLILRDRNGKEHVASATVSRIRLENETVVQIVLRDMSAASEISQRADFFEIELMSEQRLAKIGLLASGVAHNINTPLMGIYGLAQVIKMKHPDIEDIDGVIAQVERINGIIRNLMWKSRQDQELAKQDIDLNVLLQEELRFLEADMEFKHNVEKKFDFAHDLPPIYGRYSDFSQSLTNIIRNALDAMHGLNRKVLIVRSLRENDDIVISIQDTGAGIAHEHINQVFDPFFTTKPAVGKAGDGEPTGTGLGLSTVQKLLKPYGCRYEITSDTGKGTIFNLFVPIAQNQYREEQVSENRS